MQLQDLGSVSLLDAAAHRHRKAMFLSLLAPEAVRRLGEKAMFLSLLAPEAVRRLGEVVRAHWRARLTEWVAEGRVTLHTSVEGILCRAVGKRAGVPLAEGEA